MEFVSKYDIMGLIGCNSLNILNIDIVNYRRLEKIVDLLGKAKQKANQLLLYIYDDGTVVKKLFINKFKKLSG